MFETFPIAYIDPGLLSLALQAVFVFLFSALTAYLLAPWKWLTSIFRRKSHDNVSDQPASVETDEENLA